MSDIDTSWLCNSEIEKLYYEIKEVQYIDNNRWLEVSKVLLLLSSKEKNEQAKIYAFQNLGEASLQLNQIEKSIGYIMKGLEICENHHYLTDEGNLYHLLGVILSKQNNEVQSLECFLKALDCFSGNEDHLMIATIYNHIASIYVSLGDYETSMECYDIVKEHMEKELELRGMDESYVINEVSYLMNRCLTYCSMKEYSKALSSQWELMKYEGRKSVAYINQFSHVVNAKIGYNLGEYEQFKFYIRLILQEDRQIGQNPTNRKEYIELFQYLIDNNEIDLASQLLILIEKNLEEATSDTILIVYYRALANYYRVTYQESALASLYVDLYRVIKRQEDKMKELRILSIKTKQCLHCELEEHSRYEKEVKRLKKQSEIDQLTNLPNRSCLNEKTEKYFKKAAYDGTTFGILILDIDNYKEYNDYHGHLEGDRCIRKVADVIRENTKGLFCARFGGDEFFVVIRKMQEEEVLQIAQVIKNKVLELQMEQPENVQNRYVTISQGICVGIPKAGQTYSDYIHSADMALYRGKNSTRNSIFVQNINSQ